MASAPIARIEQGPSLRLAPALAQPHAQITALARSRGPIRRTLAALAGRFVALRGWETLGFARLGDYATERLGLSARQLQDLARVHRALAELPGVERALLSGALSWTKARLVARIATQEDEAQWISLAVRHSAAEMSRLVRQVDIGALEANARAPNEPETDEDGCIEEVRGGVRIRCTPAVAARFRQARQCARQVAGESLPVWECMEAIAAEVVSALPLSADSGSPRLENRKSRRLRADARPERIRVIRPNGAAPAESIGATESPHWIATLLEDVANSDAFELDARMRRAVSGEQRLEASLGPLLVQVADSRSYRECGAPTVEAYAREQIGISPRKARMLLRLERVGSRQPELASAFRRGAISWVQAHALVPVVLLPGVRARAWITHARSVSARRLSEDVNDVLHLAEANPRGLARLQGLPPSRVRLCDAAQAGRQTGAQLTAAETATFFFTGPADVAQLFRAVLCNVRRHIERLTGRMPTPGEAAGVMFDHALATWKALQPRLPAAHRVFARDGWRCTVPGCSSYRDLHSHHIRFRSAGGSDEAWNRTTLCCWHHQQGVHGGRIRCTGKAPDGLVFQLGLRPDAPPLQSYLPGERLVDRYVDYLVDQVGSSS